MKLIGESRKHKLKLVNTFIPTKKGIFKKTMHSTEFSLSTSFQKRFVFMQLHGIKTVSLNNIGHQHSNFLFPCWLIILIQGKLAFKRKIHTFLETLGKLSFRNMGFMKKLCSKDKHNHNKRMDWVR